MKLTVDIAVVVEGRELVLIRRNKPPFMDKLVLPGGHMEETDEDLAAAAVRELHEETGLCVNKCRLKFLTVLDTIGRDPRPERRISFVYRLDLPDRKSLVGMMAGSDAREVVIVSLDRLETEDLGFDHWKAIRLL